MAYAIYPTPLFMGLVGDSTRLFFLQKRKIGQAKRSISCRGGLTVQAVAASGPAAPEPGQSRPADRASISLPCQSGIGGDLVLFRTFLLLSALMAWPVL